MGCGLYGVAVSELCQFQVCSVAAPAVVLLSGIGCVDGVLVKESVEGLII